MTPSIRPVYVVAESAELRASVMDALRSLGCEAYSYETSSRAMDAISSRSPGALLVDLRLAPLPGDELCRKVKENRALARVPVIIFTSADAPLEVMRSWRAGADDFLPKPIQRAHLLGKVEALVRSGAAEMPSAAYRPGEDHRLLFVDDSRFFRTVLGGALEQSGFQLLYARSGQEALTLAEAHHSMLEAVLCDVVMPGIDGPAFVRTLRQKEGWATRPILMMSGYDLPASTVAEVERLTGAPLLEKRLFPVETIVAKVNAAVSPHVTALRATERVPFFSVVDFRAAGTEEFLSGFSYDVSPGGIFVRSLTPLPAGTPVEMRVKLSPRAPVPSCFGQVVWANHHRTRTAFSYPVGMGVRFTHLEPDQKAEVQKLVKLGGRLIAA